MAGSRKVGATIYDFKYLFLANQAELPPVQSGNKGISTWEQLGQADTAQLLVVLEVAMLEAPPVLDIMFQLTKISLALLTVSKQLGSLNTKVVWSISQT